MANKNVSQFKEAVVPDTEQYKIAFEQYKILIESMNNINDTRESSNSFWITVNGVGVSFLAYLRSPQPSSLYFKSWLIITVAITGLLFTLSWMNALYSIERSLKARYKYLMELEKNFPLQIFSHIFQTGGKDRQNQRILLGITAKEMLVPQIFFIGYIIFAVLFFFFPEEVSKL